MGSGADTERPSLLWPGVAMDSCDVTRVAHRCYQLVVVATDEDVMPPAPVTTEDHNSDR
jgi:hypothetical protein